MEILYYIGGFIVLYLVFITFLDLNKEKKINKAFSDQEGFNVTHKFISSFDKTAIAIDSDTKKIIFHDNKKKLTLINFDELISIDTIINDETFHQTKRGSQIAGGAIGGLLLGPAGLLIGGLSGKKTTVKKISKISVRATISNLDKPFCDLVFYDGNPIKPDSFLHNTFSEIADEWIGRLSVIIANK
tara:strand:+ start:30 stop:590 length:561 start_codon:yes stop_codon:yes gene_type:complete